MAEKKSQDNTGLGILLTLITLVIYFMYMKPQLTLDIMEDLDLYYKHIGVTYMMAVSLIGIMVVIHLLVNIAGFQNKCGGSALENFKQVFAPTIFPWMFVFGGIILTLIVFPGFKGAFSNVIGYYFIATRSHELLTEILGDPTTNPMLDELTPEEQEDEMNKSNLRKTSDAIVKLVGNSAILINQITPGNFVGMWEILTPLMKAEYQAEENKTTLNDIKNELLENVIFRDNIGEFCWYLYTGILVIVFVKSMLVNIECTANAEKVKEKVAQYDAKQAGDAAVNAHKKTQVYVG